MTARAPSAVSATALGAGVCEIYSDVDGVFAAALPDGSTRAGTLKTTKPK